MQNRTDIINTALQRCGAAGVNLAFQDTQDAAIAAAAYERVRKYVLSQYPWGFAQKYVALAKDVTAQPFGYESSFPLPGDCDQVIDVHSYVVDEEGHIGPARLFRQPIAKWEIVGRAIVTNAPTVALRYVSDEEHEMPEYFADVVAWRLAFEIAPYLQQGTNQAAAFMQMYQQALDDARAENDRQTHPEQVEDWKMSEHIRFMRSGLEERW